MNVQFGMGRVMLGTGMVLGGCLHPNACAGRDGWWLVALPSVSLCPRAGGTVAALSLSLPTATEPSSACIFILFSPFPALSSFDLSFTFLPSFFPSL